MALTLNNSDIIGPGWWSLVGEPSAVESSSHKYGLTQTMLYKMWIIHNVTQWIMIKIPILVNGGSKLYVPPPPNSLMLQSFSLLTHTVGLKQVYAVMCLLWCTWSKQLLLFTHQWDATRRLPRLTLPRSPPSLHRLPHQSVAVTVAAIRGWFPSKHCQLAV